MQALQVLNPALRPPIWNGTRFVPRGYALRIPGTPTAGAVDAALARLPLAQRYLAQRDDPTRRVRRGETLATVAARSGVPLARLMAANGWALVPELKRGEVVRIPLPATRASGRGAEEASPALASSVAGPPAGSPVPEPPSIAAAAVPATAVDTTPPAPAPERVKRPHEPVSEKQAATAAILPVGAPTGSTDLTDYRVAADHTVIVQPAETLGHFADWTQVPAMRLRNLNRLHKGAFVSVGHKLKLDLSRVSAEQFEGTRRDYHRRLQDAFFASHRIAGTENYIVKRGESLWTIAAHRADMPVWLVTEYNPDVDFSEVRPGSAIALPIVVAVNRQ